MRQPNFGMQEERLRESQNNLTEEDIGMNHHCLHHLPHHAPQQWQRLQQTWLIQSQYFNLKSLSNKDSLVYYQTFSETVVLNNICTDGMQCPKLLHQRCRYLIIYFSKIPIRFGEIEYKNCEQGLRLYDNYGLTGSFPYRHFFYSNQKR